MKNIFLFFILFSILVYLGAGNPIQNEKKNIIKNESKQLEREREKDLVNMMDGINPNEIALSPRVEDSIKYFCIKKSLKSCGSGKKQRLCRMKVQEECKMEEKQWRKDQTLKCECNVENCADQKCRKSAMRCLDKCILNKCKIRSVNKCKDVNAGSKVTKKMKQCIKKESKDCKNAQMPENLLNEKYHYKRTSKDNKQRPTLQISAHCQKFAVESCEEGKGRFKCIADKKISCEESESSWRENALRTCERRKKCDSALTDDKDLSKCQKSCVKKACRLRSRKACPKKSSECKRKFIKKCKKVHLYNNFRKIYKPETDPWDVEYISHDKKKTVFDYDRESSNSAKKTVLKTGSVVQNPTVTKTVNRKSLPSTLEDKLKVVATPAAPVENKAVDVNEEAVAPVENKAEVKVEATASLNNKPIDVKAEVVAPVENKAEVKVEATASLNNKPVDVKAEVIAPVENKAEVKVEATASLNNKPVDVKAEVIAPVENNPIQVEAQMIATTEKAPSVQIEEEPKTKEQIKKSNNEQYYKSEDDSQDPPDDTEQFLDELARRLNDDPTYVSLYTHCFRRAKSLCGNSVGDYKCRKDYIRKCLKEEFRWRREVLKNCNCYSCSDPHVECYYPDDTCKASCFADACRFRAPEVCVENEQPHSEECETKVFDGCLYGHTQYNKYEHMDDPTINKFCELDSYRVCGAGRNNENCRNAYPKTCYFQEQTWKEKNLAVCGCERQLCFNQDVCDRKYFICVENCLRPVCEERSDDCQDDNCIERLRLNCEKAYVGEFNK